MSQGSVCILIVGILEGRHFPRLKSDTDVYIEAKFGYKSLLTDPIQAAEKPVFNCELAFEILRKDLQLHRLNRTPVKLQLFTQSQSVEGFFSPIGQIVLDLKQAKDFSVEQPLWFPVLHCKHRGSRPEILISFYLDAPKTQQKREDGNQETQLNFTLGSLSSKDSTLIEPRHSSNNIDFQRDHCVPRSDEFTLNQSGGYFIFNQDGDKGRLMRLTVTLVFAERLELLKSSFAASGPFYFVYNIFGNQVSSEPFQSLEQPDFPAERATVRIKCLEATISNFISRLQHLEIVLLSGASSSSGSVIGKATVSLSSLISAGVAEGLYRVGDKFKSAPINDSPCVGVSVVLAFEDAQKNPALNEYQTAEVSKQTKHEDNNCSASSFKNESHVEKSESTKESAQEKCDSLENIREGNVMPGSKSVSYGREDKTPELVADLVSNSNRSEDLSIVEHCDSNGVVSEDNTQASNNDKMKHKELVSNSNVQTQDDKLLCASNVSSVITPSSSKAVINEPKKMCGNGVESLADTLTHFCLSIDLRSIQFFSSQTKCLYHVQYSYPFVGTTEHIKTSSFNADLHKTVIPNGQRTFCFVTTFARLIEVFRTIPLTLELMSDGNGNLGVANFSFEPLLHTQTTFFSHSEHVKGHRSTFSCDVLFLNRQSPAVAEISAFLSLDRLDGKANTACVSCSQTTGNQPSFSEINGAANVLHSDSKTSRHFSELKPNGKMDSEALYQQEQKLFETELKKYELELKVREAERELQLQTKFNECSRLEEKLRRALFDIEIKEQKLLRKEEQLSKQEADLKVNAEGLESKLKDLESGKKTVTDKQDAETEGLLLAQVKFLEKELNKSRKALEKALSAKLKYKRMWGSTFKELVSTRNQLPVLPSIPQIPLLPLETPKVETESSVLQPECENLPTKNTVELKSIQASLQNIGNESIASTVSTISLDNSSQGNASVVDEEYVRKLVTERDMLLQTGSYLADNKLIQQLDRHIQIARNSL